MPNSLLKKVLIVVSVAALVVVAVIGYAVFRTPQAASGPLEAIPIAEAPVATVAQRSPTATPAANPTPLPAPTSTREQVATAEPEQGASLAPLPPEEPTNLPASEPDDVPGTATSEAPEPSQEAASGQAQASSPQIFEIVPGESQARFLIDEVLRGQDKTVVGVTDQVAGQIAIDAAAPANTRLGPILINARTLTTDNATRNRAIKNAILRTDSFEFVTFTPTDLRGLPAAVALGQAFEFEIAGELTVTDVTRQVVFTASVLPVSSVRVEGIARTTILYRDFNLFIPNSPQVQTVANEVILELEFVAAAVSDA